VISHVKSSPDKRVVPPLLCRYHLPGTTSRNLLPWPICERYQCMWDQTTTYIRRKRPPQGQLQSPADCRSRYSLHSV
jgi:hypothetical protein